MNDITFGQAWAYGGFLMWVLAAISVFALAGVNDPVAFLNGPDVPPNVTSAFRESDTNDFRILMSHRPLGFDVNAKRDGVDFQLSGHTHGGVCPGLAQVVALMNGGFVRGFYEVGDARLYVSPGAGLWAGFPIRFFNRSEITLFVLRRASAMR